MPSTPIEIAVAIATWAQWPGFSGESCGSCPHQANVLGGPGWTCPDCGEYNCQSFNHHRMPWDNPDSGPTLDTIYQGGKLYQRCGETAIDHSPKIGDKIAVLPRCPAAMPDYVKVEVLDYWLVAGWLYMYVRIMSLVEVKMALVKKYERLAKLAGSKAKRKKFHQLCGKYRSQLRFLPNSRRFSFPHKQIKITG